MSLVEIHPRGEWQEASRPVTGPMARPSEWRAVVYHYPGSSAEPPTTLAGLFALARAMQRSYLASRGYSLGYCYLIGPNGDVVEVRGRDIRNAANNGVPSMSGYTNYNIPTVSVQFVVKDASTTTALQLGAAARLHVTLERSCGRQLSVEGHGDKDATPCPGTGIKSQLPLLRQLIEEVRNPAPLPPAPVTPIPPYTIPQGEPMITGLWKGPNDPAVFACSTERTKVWCYPGTVDDHQALLRLEGKSDEIRTQTSAEMFRAMGPVVGPRPESVDEYGWKD